VLCDLAFARDRAGECLPASFRVPDLLEEEYHNYPAEEVTRLYQVSGCRAGDSGSLVFGLMDGGGPVVEVPWGRAAGQSVGGWDDRRVCDEGCWSLLIAIPCGRRL
jgi:hypothetical protein